MAESGSNTQFPDIWTSALEKHRHDTNKDPTLTPLEADSPDVLPNIIEAREKLSSPYWNLESVL